ncbi:ATP-binding protein [Actinomadura harenae]|uniref:ATP-binding protein n=1 Tax=Actinomadura harenae TaxID=2483351 RepID=UPI0018F417DD|nr:ATP-binding protein [Actinomadura harenae]
MAAALPTTPSIVVMDEVPWLAEQDALFDGALQTAWDRLLSSRPVLLLLVGSDPRMMEQLTAYDRPFFGRADNMVLAPLNVAEIGRVLGLDASDAVDAQLVSGGLPGIVRTWPHATPALEFLREGAADPAAAVFGIPESVLLAEFPNPDTARRVIEAVGAGERTHADIAASAGSRGAEVPSGTLSPLLRRLVEEKRVLAVDQPLSTRPGKPALYRVADSNLRLYLGVLRMVQEQARRGRPEAGFRLIERRWPTWRGRAVGPLVRESLELAAGDDRLPWPRVESVGGWWNRRFDPEVDLVGADREPIADTVSFVGSIKWLGGPFDHHDLTALRHAAVEVPGFDRDKTGTVIASLNGTSVDLDLTGSLLWTPQDLIDSWSS